MITDWIDPSIIMPKWTFVMPHSTICAASGDLWLLSKSDWRTQVSGMRTGFHVRSIEQAICIMKLAYFNVGSFIPNICRFVNPEAIKRLTTDIIEEANLDPDHPNWINYLGIAYTEAYAQWLDSLGESLRGEITDEWKEIIVVNNRSQVATRERKIIDALNIVGTSINRAINITNIATREEFRNQKANRILLFYAWVDKETTRGKTRKILDTSNLPWKEFKSYAKSCFVTKRAEYDSEDVNSTWNSELKYHDKELSLNDGAKTVNNWMMSQTLLGWAAAIQSDKDAKKIREEKITIPDIERLTTTFVTWKATWQANNQDKKKDENMKNSLKKSSSKEYSARKKEKQKKPSTPEEWKLGAGFSRLKKADTKRIEAVQTGNNI